MSHADRRQSSGHTVKHPRVSRRERRGLAALVIALHVGGVLTLVRLASVPPKAPEIQSIEIALIQAQTPAPVQIQPPAPPPPAKVTQPAEAPPRPAPRPAVKPAPKPAIKPSPTAIETAPPEPAPPPAPTPAPEALSPQPAAAPSTAPVKAAAPAATPAPAPVTLARFDADYLNNPAPAYPQLSRRMREEGKVLLRVVVSADGTPRLVEISQGSGSERLDKAARSAVERWRFVPARQGERAIEAAVLVPIIFKLEGN
ncbi:energy transducer TonB [Parazoarcus communis]|uniref:Protein TonB n=1 Tax=Parazoarcus communis TaxID=41977 RepID=A0A2U8H1Y3_9RHOO|nr:energy transducer TonB [Parazoarcus communis]AWI79658.1 energy transducer TonB [Parazoarcus communis]